MSKLESLFLKDALCQVWLKLFRWLLRRRWKCEKFIDGQTDMRTTGSEKLTWVFSSYEPNRHLLVSFYPLMHTSEIRILLSILKYEQAYLSWRFNFNQLDLLPYLWLLNHCSIMVFFLFNTCMVKEFKWSLKHRYQL